MIKVQHIQGSFVVSVLMLVLVFAVAPAFSQESYETKIKQAILAEDWDKVVKVGREWQPSEADAPIANWLLGYAGLATGNYQLSARSFLQLGRPGTPERLLVWAKQLADQNQTDAVARMLKGDALARSGKYEEALAALDEAIRLEPQSALLYNVRGVVRVLADKVDEAAGDFEKAIELAPNFTDALTNIGILRLIEGDFIGALEYLNKVIRLCPNFSLAINARGVVYSNLKAWESSEQDFRKAMDLDPTLWFASGNLKLLAWIRGQEQFRWSRMTGQVGSRRGTTLVASSYERYSINIGDGRMVDVFSIKNTPQTATLAGMEETFRHITSELGAEARLPRDWRPEVLLVQPGLGSSAYAERVNFAKMTFNSGKDFAISVDMTDRFKWPTESRDLRMLRIDEDVSRRVERAVVAAKHIWGKAPDAVFESQATRLLLNGKLGSTTIPDMFANQRLHPDFELGRVTVMGMPLRGQTIDSGFQRSCLGDVLAITTPSRTGFIASEPLGGAASVQVLTRTGEPPSHLSLFANRWKGNQNNPVSELVGLHIRGTNVSAIQNYTDQLRDRIPMYTSRIKDPMSVHDSMISMTRRGLTDPLRDGVLVGCKDPGLGQRIKTRFGSSWRVKLVKETNPLKLQEMARIEGFTRINRVAEFAQPDDSLRRHIDHISSPAWTLPDMRSLTKNVDRFNTAVDVLHELGGAKMPSRIKLPLEFGTSIAQDIQRARQEKYTVWTSRILEQAGRFGMEQLPSLVDSLQAQGKLSTSFKLHPTVTGLPDIMTGAASQIGRGQQIPSVFEVTCYLDGINKAAWATVGATLGGPKGATIASTSAGFAADFMREATQPVFDKWAHNPVRRQMIHDWKIHLGAAQAHGAPVRSFSEMFGSGLLRRTGFDDRSITELDSIARVANSIPRIEQQQPSIWPKIQEFSVSDIPAIATPQQYEVRSQSFQTITHDIFQDRGLSTRSYRLPSTELLGGKRGGVAMKADVVKGQPADTTGMFGADKAMPQASIPQEGMICPFLVFCVLPSELQ